MGQFPDFGEILGPKLEILGLLEPRPEDFGEILGPPLLLFVSKLDSLGVPTGFANSANQASLTEGGFFFKQITKLT